MRLLIVVDKLLTGFDAPSCTYLYIDKSMQDHGLFQAICRTNRLDGDDKPFGYIVDYKDLFKKVQGAIAVYTSELDTSDGGAEPGGPAAGPAEGRPRAPGGGPRGAARSSASRSQPPEGRAGAHPLLLRQHRDRRRPGRATSRSGWRSTRRVAALRAGLCQHRPTASGRRATRRPRPSAIEREVDRAVELREIIRRASGETLDLKAYEADMRHLIDAYIKADEARKISDFGEVGLLDLIVKSGIAAAIASLPDRIRANQDAVAEIITNNVRSRIIREHLHDPAFYDRMSTLLAEVLADLRARRIDYEEFLKRMAAIAVQVQSRPRGRHARAARQEPGLAGRLQHARLDPGSGDGDGGATARLRGRPPDPLLELAQSLDARLRGSAPDGWRGVLAKERAVKGLIFEVVQDEALVELLFPVIKAQAEY